MKLALLIALAMLCWLEAYPAEPAAYQSSGWRPQGQTLNPCYLPPAKMTRTINKQQRIPTGTPKSRETTTTRNEVNDSTEELYNEQSPALAVANSFAFNRPIYVYNAYPYRLPSAYLFRG